MVRNSLTDAAKAVLDNVGSNAIVDVIGTTSPEGPTKVNEKLSVARAQSIANYLTNRGVKVNSSTGGANGRTGIVIVK
jgi:outer membrane protein OmpA-like peptidoglycan-associated protein